MISNGTKPLFLMKRGENTDVADDAKFLITHNPGNPSDLPMLASGPYTLPDALRSSRSPAHVENV